MILEMLKVILLGIVEGITEWLPISSTGHMILVDEFIKLNVSEAFMEMFLVVIQLGAILAVCVLYFHKLNPFSPKKTTVQKKETLQLWGKVIVGCVPAAIIGILFDDTIDALFYNPQTVSFTLILYGILFIVVENYNKNRKPSTNTLADLTYKTAIFIGCFQILALIPGTSRSGATILGAMILGTSRFVAAEYSFFLSIPVMFGASLLKMLKYGFSFTGNEMLYLIVGMVVAFAVSILAIKFLLGYIKKNDFKAFGVYRIVLGVIVAAYFLLR
ncbi:MAG: undecaprenyl-diphosphate phosphatase [Anaerobutyricum sp.]|nr:undecaprenyl-diphosphate phosphatase [Eubacterium sp.]MDY6046099.1 undecaprenyl-diphosphate phosphatase [Anaerobutyricum sp.]